MVRVPPHRHRRPVNSRLRGPDCAAFAKKGAAGYFFYMKHALLELLQCPACGASDVFSLRDETADEHEIVEGVVVCGSCSAPYEVRAGYCDLMPAPSELVRREQAAQRAIESRGPAPDPAAAAEYILRLPEGNEEAEEHAPLVEYAVGELCADGGATVLDLGGGLGWTSAMFARAGCRCVLVDIYSTVLEASRCFAGSGAYFDRVLADMSSLPLRAGVFDAVFANAAVHHTPDLEVTMRQVGRVLKPGGRVIFVNEPVVGRWERRRPAEFGAEYRKEGIRERAYTVGEWRRAFRGAGLGVKFKIPDVGVEQKIKRRLALPSYARFPRKQALTLLARPALRRLALKTLAPAALRVYPFNVVISGTK